MIEGIFADIPGILIFPSRTDSPALSRVIFISPFGSFTSTGYLSEIISSVMSIMPAEKKRKWSNLILLKVTAPFCLAYPYFRSCHPMSLIL
jgi:hypothetical protein